MKTEGTRAGIRISVLTNLPQFFHSRIAILFGFLLILSACREQHSLLYHYPHNPTGSYPNGYPIGPETSYWPDILNLPAGPIYTSQNTILNANNSYALFLLREPVLYNYYLGHDRYRFTWIPEDKPFVFTLHRNNSKVWLNAKSLNKHPYRYHASCGGSLITISHSNKRETSTEPVSEQLPKEIEIPVIMEWDTTVQLTMTDWMELETLIEESGFWERYPVEPVSVTSTSEWIIEAHLRHRYWFTNTRGDNTMFGRIGVFFQTKSKMKERIL